MTWGGDRPPRPQGEGHQLRPAHAPRGVSEGLRPRGPEGVTGGPASRPRQGSCPKCEPLLGTFSFQRCV